MAEIGEKTELTPEEKKEKAISAAEFSTLTTLVGGILFGLIGLIGYPLTIAAVGPTLLFIGLLMAGASLITGFFTGTLFGIPKRNNDATKDYTLNNSLVEIADWLTKIIVGLGLVNLKQIPIYLLRMGNYVNDAANLTANRSASVFTMCIVIYFGMLGLYIGYNYMRLVLSAKYKYADDNLMEKELKEAKQQAAQQSNEVEKQKDNVRTLKSELLNIVKPPANRPISMNNKAQVDEMVNKAKDKLEKGLIKNKAINDPQKGMWGGKNENNDRKLSAVVKQFSKDLYKLNITLQSTDPANHPLKENDVILFALHDTFRPFYYIINIENQKAELELYSYGSFTIGAFCDIGDTQLELDLAEIPGVSQDFKES